MPEPPGGRRVEESCRWIRGCLHLLKTQSVTQSRVVPSLSPNQTIKNHRQPRPRTPNAAHETHSEPHLRVLGILEHHVCIHCVTLLVEDALAVCNAARHLGVGEGDGAKASGLDRPVGRKHVPERRLFEAQGTVSYKDGALRSLCLVRAALLLVLRLGAVAVDFLLVALSILSLCCCCCLIVLVLVFVAILLLPCLPCCRLPLFQQCRALGFFLGLCGVVDVRGVCACCVCVRASFAPSQKRS